MNEWSDTAKRLGVIISGDKRYTLFVTTECCCIVTEYKAILNTAKGKWYVCMTVADAV